MVVDRAGANRQKEVINLLVEFDYHAATKRLAVRRGGENNAIELRTLRNEIIGAVPGTYLPLGPRWSPDGSQISHGSNGVSLYLYAPGEGAPETLFSDPELNVGSHTWSPDGDAIAFSAYRQRPWRQTNIYVINTETRDVVKIADTETGWDRVPVWSPSGQWIAFTREWPDTLEAPPSSVCLYEVHTGRSVTVPQPGSRIGRFSWSPDSSHLLLRVRDDDAVRLDVVQLEDLSVTWSHRSRSIKGAAFSPGGHVLSVCHDEITVFDFPGGNRIAQLPMTNLAPVANNLSGPGLGFDVNSAVYFLTDDYGLYRWNLCGEVKLILSDPPEPEPVHSHQEYRVVSSDGLSVPVHRFVPKNPRPTGVMYLHSGNGTKVGLDPVSNALLEQRYEIVMPAFRGSGGYGKAHQKASIGECGRGDVLDVLVAGLDWMRRTGGDRSLALVGYGYGGFVTLLSLAHEQAPWVGGVTLWGVSDLTSLLSIHRRAYPTDRRMREKELIERSPLSQARHIHVPLLMVHGGLDHSASTDDLRKIQRDVWANHVGCRLVVFEDDTHGLRRHRDEIQGLLLGFLNRLDSNPGGSRPR